MYTRCPNCQTYFKISAEHLKKAGGKVRCGQCMKVFNSLGNLLEDLPVSLAERTRPATIAPKPPPTPTPTPVAAKPANTAPPRPAPAVVPSKPIPPVAAPLPKPIARPRPTPTPPTRPPAAPARRAAPVEESVFIVEEIPAEKPFRAERAEMEPMPTFDLDAQNDTLDLNSEDQIRNLDVGPTSSVRDLVPYPGPAPTPEIEPGPFGNSFFGGAVVFLLLVFIIQYSYFMRDDLARYSELRPWVQTLCGVLDCELPMQQNVDLIKLTHRDITVHPRVKGALLINAVFVNTASYTQPFPLMQITLSDVGGRVIAKRRFQPAEYLDADVNLRRGMPSNSPIQIVLEIADPGKDAENFEFNFFYVN